MPHYPQILPSSYPTLPPNAFSANKQAIIRLNEQKIKLFISECTESIPDIVNQPQQSIFSHFKFYFNDDQLMLECYDQIEDIVSLMHHINFQRQIHLAFEKWKQTQKQNQPFQKNNKETKKDQSIKDQKHISYENGEQNQKSIQHKNFIAFVQFWVRNNKNLKISYQLYDEIVSECVNNFMDNVIIQINHNLISDLRPFKLKNSDKEAKKREINQLKCINLSSDLSLKRLNIYFNHFSKMQNLPSSSSSSNYCSNGSKTFDQIGKSYSTINLQQWICFIKAFNFDKIFQQNHKNKAKQNQNSKKINNKQYLPVKYVKWNTSLHFFKNLFQKYCDNSKQLSFVTFQVVVKKLFIQLFTETNKAELIPIQNSNCAPQIKSSQKNVQVSGVPTTKQSSLPQQIGIDHLKLSNQQQFHNKLRALGIFVPYQITHIPKLSLEYPNNNQSCKKSKSYSHIKPKYLGLLPPPNISPHKIKQGLQNNRLEKNKDLILPSLQQKSNTRLKKYLTLSQLMQQKQKQIQIKQQQQRQSEQRKQISSKTGKDGKQNKQQKRWNKNKEKLNGILSKKKSKYQQNNKQKMIQAKMQDEEQDQFLMKYYNKNSVGESKIQWQTKYQSRNLHYHDSNHQLDISSQYCKTNNANLLKRIDQRIQKMNKKIL